MGKLHISSTFGRFFFISLVLALICIMPHAVTAQDKRGPIVIGIDTELTGTIAEASTECKKGYDIYLEEVGYKVAGRPVKIIEYDNKTDVRTSMEAAQRLVEKDNVHILTFGSSSAGGIPVRAYAVKNQLPFGIVANCGAEVITLPPSKYVFRPTYADGQGEVVLGRYAYEKLGYKKMTLMGPDFAGSTGKLWAFQTAFQKAGGKIVQTILWPVGEMDLAPYFAQLNTDTDAIFPFIPGDVSILRFFSTYFELGLDKKGIKLCTHYAMPQDYLTIPVFKEKMIGVVSFDWYNPYMDTPENKRVSKLYYAKYGKNKMINSYTAFGYEAMKFIFAALDRIKGNIEDKEAFLKSVHATKIKGLCSSSVSIDENGSAIRDVLIHQVQKKDGIVRNVVLDVIPQVHQPPEGTAVMPGKGK